MTDDRWLHEDGTEYAGDRARLTVGKRGTVATYPVQERCARCGGAGGAQKWAHTGWTCFDCGGSGKGPVRDRKVWRPEARAKLDAARAARAATRDAARAVALAARAEALQATRAAFDAAHPEVAADLAIVNGRFGDSLRESLARFGALTDAQCTALAHAAARARDPGRHWGVVGERAEVRVRVTRVLNLGPARYGYRSVCRYLVAFETEDGAALVWFTTEPQTVASYDREVDEYVPRADVFAVRATVKEHGMWSDKPQTTVTRVTLMEEVPA